MFDGQDFNPELIKQKLKKLNEEYSLLLENYFSQKIAENVFEKKSKSMTSQIKDLENKLNSCSEMEDKISLFNIRFDRFLDSLNDIPQKMFDVIRLVISKVYVNKKPINNQYDITIVYKFEE